nr:hypothetical protein CFP56_70668 [Quercus suber]
MAFNDPVRSTPVCQLVHLNACSKILIEGGLSLDRMFEQGVMYSHLVLLHSIAVVQVRPPASPRTCWSHRYCPRTLVGDGRLAQTHGVTFPAIQPWTKLYCERRLLSQAAVLLSSSRCSALPRHKGAKSGRVPACSTLWWVSWGRIKQCATMIRTKPRGHRTTSARRSLRPGVAFVDSVDRTCAMLVAHRGAESRHACIPRASSDFVLRIASAPTPACPVRPMNQMCQSRWKLWQRCPAKPSPSAPKRLQYVARSVGVEPCPQPVI